MNPLISIKTKLLTLAVIFTSFSVAACSPQGQIDVELDCPYIGVETLLESNPSTDECFKVHGYVKNWGSVFITRKLYPGTSKGLSIQPITGRNGKTKVDANLNKLSGCETVCTLTLPIRFQKDEGSSAIYELAGEFINNDCKPIEFEDLYLDKNTMSGTCILSWGNILIFGDTAGLRSLDTSDSPTDSQVILVDLDSLPRKDRKRFISECDVRNCKVEFFGVVEEGRMASDLRLTEVHFIK